MKEYYGTLSQTMNALKKEGYNHEFQVGETCLLCHHAEISLAPEEFQTDKIYRFEGESNPSDESILYAISSTQHQVKGLIVNGYGATFSNASAELVARLNERH